MMLKNHQKKIENSMTNWFIKVSVLIHKQAKHSDTRLALIMFHDVSDMNRGVK